MSLEAERDALRQRLGSGARFDAASAPARELGWARRGTAYFARKLNELTDDALDSPSLIPGWNRARVAAMVGYQARWLALAIEEARTGVPVDIPDPEEQAVQIALGATLPARALRNLFDHAEVHLNVEWRDLTDADWEKTVRGLETDAVPVRETVLQRACAIWVHAVDLDNGGSFLDFPADLLDALKGEIIGYWHHQGTLPDLTLAATDSPMMLRLGTGTKVITGATPDLIRWLSGRGARRLQSQHKLPALPAGPALVGRHSRLYSQI